MLKQLTNKTILNITYIFNTMLRLFYFLTLWKLSTIIIVPKSGKPKNITSFNHPINFLPVFVKLLKNKSIRRFQSISETNKFIPHSQFGFLINHSIITLFTILQTPSHHPLNIKNTA